MAADQQHAQLPELTREFTNSEKFFRYFQHEVTDLQDQMALLTAHGTSGGERSDAVDHCQAGIARLSDSVKDASSIIPAYDQRTYGEAIKALSSKLAEIKASFAPRRKFAFKSGVSFTARKNASAISLEDAASLAEQKRRGVPGYVVADGSSGESSLATTPAHLRSPAPERVDEAAPAETAHSAASSTAPAAGPRRIRHPSFSQSTSVQISDHERLHILLPPSAARATTSGTLSNLHRCVVDLSSPTTSTAGGQPFAGLTLRHISCSLVICGEVAGAAHLTDITRSVIVVSSRQFRMHESSQCHVYLRTSGRPIIEDCSGIQFAPLPGRYANATATEEERREDQWDQVDDFKWLRSERSPNWSTLDLSDRVTDDVWRDVVPGGHEHGVEEILRAVGVPT